ncbi:MAG TPA: 6-pyruvoyl-tetrahydropterin synthase-related protein [Patescibacteria group bacterium]|nr:6-pyruvoyl-tetrahydropterin synthase-related protein [Patescibacteria group bacterium]
MELIKKNLGLIIVIILGAIPLFSLLHPGLPLTHDGQDHVARIANFYQSLSEGNIIPRWAGNLDWGYGHPILMFLYPFSSYAASFFHFLGFNFVDSLKIVFGLGFIASGICMYIWLREFLGEKVAIAGATLYLYAPYRFVDLYVRGAIGEHMAFIFPPLIAYFLIKMVNKKSYWYFLGATLSIAGLILSHNALLIMFLPIIMIYGLYLILTNKKQSQRLIIEYLLALLLGFSLSSFFIIPAFLEGKYTLRDIVTDGEVLKRFVQFKNIIYSPWGYGDFSVQLGIAQWATIIFFPFVIYKLKKNTNNLILYLIFFVYFLGSIVIMLPEAKLIWQVITTLQKFQFPWRFLSASVFSAALLGSFFVFVLKKNVQLLGVVLIVVFSIILTKTYWQPKAYLMKPEAFYTGIYNGTTDTGESAPIWSVRFMENRPKARIEVIEGKATIKNVSRNSTEHVYTVVSNGNSGLRENTLFFPGWKVYIDGVEYQNVEFQDPHNRGLMTFKVPNGEHKVDIKFENTKLRTISNVISLVSIAIVFLVYFVWKQRIKKLT